MRNALILTAMLLGGCAGWLPQSTPDTLGAKAAASTYIPIDPLKVVIASGSNCDPSASDYVFLNTLPDNYLRMAIGSFDADGNIQFGVGSVAGENEQFKVVQDYINADTANVRFAISWVREGSDPRPFYAMSADEAAKMGYSGSVRRIDSDQAITSDFYVGADQIVIPVYIGVGLRITADVTVIKANTKITSLGAIGFEASANNLTGTLVVQTLGITGDKVRASIPMPNELNNTTVQNSIMALGAIKATLGDSAVIAQPRATGFYNPIGSSDKGLMNAIVSELSREPIVWEQECGLRAES